MPNCGCTCNANKAHRGCVGHSTSCTRPNNNISLPFGGSGSDSAIYNNTEVGKIVITASQFSSLKDSINEERNRRSFSDISLNAPVGSLIEAEDYNALREGLITLPATGSTDETCNPNNGQTSNDNGVTRPATDPAGACHTAGSAYVPTITSMTIGKVITALDFNELILDLKSSGASCFCDCNYCACNCNYCACNCNYGCTCECNYSDETLKENIEYL